MPSYTREKAHYVVGEFENNFRELRHGEVHQEEGGRAREPKLIRTVRGPEYTLKGA
jgi:hypothetical protein